MQVMIIGDIVPSFLNFLNAPEILQDRTLVLVLSGLLVLFPLSSMPSTSTAASAIGTASIAIDQAVSGCKWHERITSTM